MLILNDNKEQQTIKNTSKTNGNYAKIYFGNKQYENIVG
jgi:hypothetical protein